MQIDNIRVSRKLWGAFILLMLAMLLISGFQQYRANSSMSAAMDQVVEIEERISAAIRWRGATETAVNMVMGGAVTTDAVLAQQYDAKVKEIIGGINKIQEGIVAGATAPEEKAALDKVLAERKLVLAATAKTWELKGAGDGVATQQFADNELTPMVARYLKAQDDFVAVLQKRREEIRIETTQRRVAYAIQGLVVSAVLIVVVLLLAWKLVRSITVPLDEAVETIDAIAAGDLTRELQSTRKDEFGHMLRSLSAMSTRLRGVVSEVRVGVDSVSSASIQIANGNHDLSARTEQTASNLEETAASMEELTATVSQSADTARQANQLAGTAAQAAARGGEVVGQVVASMQQITDIIAVIDGIAFQTNILALNAAVEAARAGEQGRGFAVVASEVRNLAQRSAEAAKEIKALIGASVEKVDAGTHLVGNAGQSIEDIVAQVKRVSDLIGEISSATGEQTIGISQVGEAVTQLDQVTQQNAALVEQSAAAADSLKHQAARLAEIVSVFRLVR